MPESPSPSRVQLNGWKEIAAFFGKSTRTVQRWEAELGLPVRRLRGQSGEIVYAWAEDLDRWREERSHDSVDRLGEVGTEAERDANESRPITDGGASPSRPSPTATRRRRIWWLPASVLVLVTLAGVWWSLRPGDVVTAEFRGNTVVALDLDGRQVWSFHFQQPLWVQTGTIYRPLRAHVPGDPPIVADVDGDGRPEVLAIATYGDITTGEKQTQELFCLSASGQLLWRYTPVLSYTFSGRTFDTSWRFLNVLVAEGARSPAVWVSVAASPWWPSVLVRLDGRGEPSVRFVHSGALYYLQQHRGPDGWSLLAGGINNEYASAALAVLGEDNMPAVSPQAESSVYRCDNCPAGLPTEYFLFPRSDIHIAEAEKPYNAVFDIRRSSSGFEVLTLESAQHSAMRFFRFTADGEPASVVMSDSTAHGELERAGRLDHRDADCEWRRNGVRVRRFAPSAGWSEFVVPPGK